jgi:prolyl oligopeptidase
MDGKAAGEIAFPTLGKAAGFKGKRKDMETFYSFTSYLYPTTVFRYDIATGQSTVFRKPEIDFDPSGYETEQVFFESKDGTRVPMFLTHRKGIARDGTNPTLLYGYGGFQYALTPSFSVSNLVWLEMGGIYASVNLRGGSEYGEAWHAAGMKEKKQNVFDDFIAAAEYLTREGYTSREKLAMHGGSNGGLLVGAAMTQRPDLFAVAVPEVGVMDMLRFHKFTIGWGWASDYGSSDDPAGFKYLSAYSPLHNLKAGTEYPATLVMTADHDDRVVPAHSFKFAATLQGAQAGEEPVLIRIDSNAGHGAGMPTMQVINEVADRWAFIVHNLHMKVDLGRGSDGL